MGGQRLNHAEAKSRAANAASGAAQCGAVQFVERAIKRLAVLDLVIGQVVPTALIGIHAIARDFGVGIIGLGSFGIGVLRGGQILEQRVGESLRALDGRSFLGEHLLDRQRCHGRLPACGGRSRLSGSEVSTNRSEVVATGCSVAIAPLHNAANARR